MEPPDELLEFFKALADKNRLKIPGLLNDQALPLDEIAERLHLTVGEATHHVEYLLHIGLIKFSNRDGVILYTLDTTTLEQTAKRLLARPKQLAPAALNATEDFTRKTLSDFLNPDNTIKELPAQPKKFNGLMYYVLSLFEPERRYTEKEVNEIIKRVHPDTASLRRALIDHRLMARAKGQYWRMADK